MQFSQPSTPTSAVSSRPVTASTPTSATVNSSFSTQSSTFSTTNTQPVVEQPPVIWEYNDGIGTFKYYDNQLQKYFIRVSEGDGELDMINESLDRIREEKKQLFDKYLSIQKKVLEADYGLMLAEIDMAVSNSTQDTTETASSTAITTESTPTTEVKDMTPQSESSDLNSSNMMQISV